MRTEKEDIHKALSNLNNELQEEIKLDSEEEKYFLWWLEDLKKHGLIINYLHHPKVFELSDKVNAIRKKNNKKGTAIDQTYAILREHVYTTDVFILWNPDMKDILFSTKENVFDNTLIAREFEQYYTSYVEVKPVFDQNNMTRLFVINQKWVYDKYQILVNMVIPQELFENTFTPLRYLLTNKSAKGRKINFKVKTIKEFLDKIQGRQLTLL